MVCLVNYPCNQLALVSIPWLCTRGLCRLCLEIQEVNYEKRIMWYVHLHDDENVILLFEDVI